MEKLIYLIFQKAELPGSELRATLIEKAAPALRAGPGRVPGDAALRAPGASGGGGDPARPGAVGTERQRGRLALARNIHEGPTAAAHLRTLERDIDVRLLDVLRSTSLGGALRKESECADFSSQSTHLHALATDPHE